MKVRPARRAETGVGEHGARARVRAFPRDANVELRVTQFGHGQSNPTYKVECVRVDDARTTKRPPRVLATYVLRKNPPGALLRSAHAVEREFAVQRALSSRAARRVAVVPVPGALSMSKCPSDCRASPCTIDSPRPVPLPISLVVKNGSKILLRTSSLMPVPLSSTSIRTYSPIPIPSG